MKSSTQSSPGSLGSKVGCQRWNRLGVVAGVVSELDSDGLRGTLRDGSVQLGDGSLRLDSLIKPDESNTLGDTSHRSLLRTTWERSMNISTISKNLLPEMLSQRILLVMMLPHEENILSRSGWVMCLGRPDTYRLAPLIASLLGRAKETWKKLQL